MISVVLPLRTVSEANFHGHWRVRHKRVQAQHRAVALGLTAAWRKSGLALPLIVTLTRIAPRKLDKGDNSNTSCKYVRDAVAKVIGIDDGSDLIEWRYAQRKGEPHQCAVEIRIEAGT